MTAAVIEENEFKIEEAGAGDREWEAFVARHSECFFCTPAWSRILDAGYGIRTRVYLLKQAGKIQLGLPAAQFDFGLFRLVHAYTPYGEFVGEQELIPSFLKALEKYAAASGIHQIRVTQPHYQKYELDLSYRAKRDCLQLLDLSGLTPDSLWDGYKKNIRRDVRIAQRAGVTVEPLGTAAEIDRYYAMYRKTMKRKGALGPHPRRLYHEIASALGADGRALFLAAKYRGEYAAGVVLICSGATVYLLGNASDADRHALCPNDLLMHESLLFALKNGFRYFDFMTTSEAFDTPGKLSAYKEKWGAARLPFTVYEKDLSAWRAGLWRAAWKAANSRLGSALLRPFVN